MSDYKEWSFYFPEEGENKDDATVIIGKVWDADDAAQMACEYDFSSRGGWERGQEEFDIVIINPDGEEFSFVGWHEPSVEHRAKEKRLPSGE